MKCNICCSIGEVIDKITILRIKKEKTAVDSASRANIMLELGALESQLENLVPKEETLVTKLQEINRVLWDLEDDIREKSRHKCFDESYISCAERIHTLNDERYRVKREINMRYQSDIVEEKVYALPKKDESQLTDVRLLEYGKEAYGKGEYRESFRVLLSLVEKYDRVNEENDVVFNMDLRISFDIIAKHFDADAELVKRNTESLAILNDLFHSTKQRAFGKQFIEFWKRAYYVHCLYNHNYLCTQYGELHNCVYGPRIVPEEMSFFECEDVGKTLLVYDGGGIGDMIMFFRFIRTVCEKYPENKVIVLVRDELVWIFEESHSDVCNLSYVRMSERNTIPTFDHHCSSHMFLSYLRVDYCDVPYVPYMKGINPPTTDHRDDQRQCQRARLAKSASIKETVLFNWKGSPKFPQEHKNRRMRLELAIPLFQLPNIRWVVVTQDVTAEEHRILEENGVIVMSEIDSGPHAFAGTIQLLKDGSIDRVVTTDTAVLHVAGTMDVPTVALLTKGCEWRWNCKDAHTNWYPNITMLKQKTQGDWSPVVSELCHIFVDGKYGRQCI